MDKHVKGLRDYWKETPKTRFNAWNKYARLIDREVTRLENLIKKYKIGSYAFEKVRTELNDMYQTQYQLEHTSH
jgi:hypothetical protein